MYTVFNETKACPEIARGRHLGPVGSPRERGLLEDHELTPVLQRWADAGRILLFKGEFATREEARTGPGAPAPKPEPPKVEPPKPEPPPAPRAVVVEPEPVVPVPEEPQTAPDEKSSTAAPAKEEKPVDEMEEIMSGLGVEKDKPKGKRRGR